MQNLSIRQILTLLIVIPAIGAMITFAQIIPDGVAQYRQATGISHSVGIVKAAGDIVHELQKERGSSSGLAAATTNKDEHRARVATAQAGTDNALQAFNTAYDTAKAAGLVTERTRHLAEAHRRLASELAPTRENVLKGGLKAPDVVAFYSGLIDHLIAGVGALANGTVTDEINDLKSAFENLMIAKEFAGLQRAIGNAVIAGGGSDPVIRERFIAVSSLHERYLTAVTGDRTPHVAESLRRHVPADLSAAFVLHVQNIIRATREGKAIEVNSAAWWALTTKRIDALKQVEGDIVSRLEALGKSRADEVSTSLMTSFGFQSVFLLIGVILMFNISRALAGPVRAAALALEQGLTGDPDVVAPPLMSDRSEIGRISNAVGRFIELSKEREGLVRDRAETERRVADERKKALKTLETEFNTVAGQTTDQLKMASAMLAEKATSMLGTVEQVKIAQDGVQDASLRSSETVNDVSRLSQELQRSIAEIAEQSTRNAEMTKEVLIRAEQSREASLSFEEVAGAIGSIVDLINSIAAQTNLLALNATIESARAGEAGRGFAVVAGEVKNLAARTVEATRTIGQKVNELKSIAGTAAHESEALSRDVGTMQGLNSAIAAAVHEQHMTSEGFTQSIQSLADIVGQVTQQVSEIAELGSSAHEAANAVQDIADEMDRTTATLAETLPQIVAETSKRIAA